MSRLPLAVFLVIASSMATRSTVLQESSFSSCSGLLRYLGWILCSFYLLRDRERELNIGLRTWNGKHREDGLQPRIPMWDSQDMSSPEADAFLT